MPYKSKAQQRFMHSQLPKIAKEFDKKTNYSKLPETGKEYSESRSTCLESNSSAQSDALNKEDMPKSFRSTDVADVFMNVSKDIQPIRGALETSEDDTLMGRLAKRIASRDYIDSLNLGMGTKVSRAKNVLTADMETSEDSFFNTIPKKVNIEGIALKKGTKVEKEHLGTLKKVEDGKISSTEAPKEIAKDHIKEMGPEYYEELNELENSLKKKLKIDSHSYLQDEKGFGLHLQTSDIRAFNSSDPIGSTNNKIIPGINMAEQAKNLGKIYNSEDTE